jgi:DNA-directed RNA polymerase specialized sigma24 family protein
MNHILSLIGDVLPPLQRQAFILNVLEEYEPFEIAMIQNRPEPQVQVPAARSSAASSCEES